MKAALQSLQNIKSYIPPAEFYRAELATMSPPRGVGGVMVVYALSMTTNTLEASG